MRRPLECVALAKRKPPVHSNTTLRHPCAAEAGQNPRPQTISTSDSGPVFKDFRARSSLAGAKSSTGIVVSQHLKSRPH